MNSTQIRREIALNGVLPPGTLHPGVESYLKDRGLYGTPTATRKIP